MDNQKMIKYKKVAIAIFIACFVIQIILLFGINKLNSESKIVTKELEKSTTDVSKVLIDDTIREQQRKMLNSIRQGWVQYLQLHPDTEVILKDSRGNVIFSDGKNQLAFDKNNMRRVATFNGSYDIIASDDKVLLKNARPKWDKEAVNKIFSVIAIPTKAFGNNGNVMIFDSYTGEIISDTRNINDNNTRYIQGESKYVIKENSVYTINEYIKQLMLKRDSDRQSDIISLFGEKKAIDDPQNTEKYPLGEYNREFTEKIILPYEFVGESNENMQMTVVLSSAEQDVFSPYNNTKKASENIVKKIDTLFSGYLAYPNISIAISILMALLSLASIGLLQCKNKNEK